MSKNIKLVKVIIEAIKSLGGEASLEDIYTYVMSYKDLDMEKYRHPTSLIRKHIYLHAKDCDIYIGPEYFYPVLEKGKGVWGLVDNKVDNVYGAAKYLTNLFSHLAYHPEYSGEARSVSYFWNGSLTDFRVRFNVGSDYEFSYELSSSDELEAVLQLLEDEVRYVIRMAERGIGSKEYYVHTERVNS